mmetsp:Transcript_26083/g.71751  ORF Transcript_26083/g.71751 Transcript_26083/m.71751 type:complete len:250 (+) Transcript_26083:213-962(+)
MRPVPRRSSHVRGCCPACHWSHRVAGAPHAAAPPAEPLAAAAGRAARPQRQQPHVIPYRCLCRLGRRSTTQPPRSRRPRRACRCRPGSRWSACRCPRRRRRPPGRARRSRAAGLSPTVCTLGQPARRTLAARRARHAHVSRRVRRVCSTARVAPPIQRQAAWAVCCGQRIWGRRCLQRRSQAPTSLTSMACGCPRWQSHPQLQRLPERSLRRARPTCRRAAATQDGRRVPRVPLTAPTAQLPMPLAETP